MTSVHIDHAVYEDLKTVMDDEFPDLIEAFVGESARQLEAAREGWHASDLEAVRRNVHSLKGSTANIGARELNRLCADIERRTRDGDIAPIPALLSAAEAELSEVTSLLTATLG